MHQDFTRWLYKNDNDNFLELDSPLKIIIAMKLQSLKWKRLSNKIVYYWRSENETNNFKLLNLDSVQNELLLLVKKDNLMRGVDYRASSKRLLLGKPFSHKKICSRPWKSWQAQRRRNSLQADGDVSD